MRTVMITGDNPLTAKAIAAEAGVDGLATIGRGGWALPLLIAPRRFLMTVDGSLFTVSGRKCRTLMPWAAIRLCRITVRW